MPCNAKCAKKCLVFPQYFHQSNVDHDFINFEIDDITFTGTKAKFLVAVSIATSMLNSTEISNPLFCSSLFMDACNEKGLCLVLFIFISLLLSEIKYIENLTVFYSNVDPVYLELSLENITGKRTKSSTTITIELEVNSIKAFAINDTQQAFILSGPEIDSNQCVILFILLSIVMGSLFRDILDPMQDFFKCYCMFFFCLIIGKKKMTFC